MIAVDGDPFLLQPLLVRVDVRLIGIATGSRLYRRLLRARRMRMIMSLGTVIVMMIVTVMMRGVRAVFRMRFEMKRRQGRKQTQPSGRRAFDELATGETSTDKLPDPIFHLFHSSPPPKVHRSYLI